MSRIVTKSLKKQLEYVRHQPISELAQEQDEQVQLIRNEPMNARNMNAT
jgi:hypothetical protein